MSYNTVVLSTYFGRKEKLTDERSVRDKYAALTRFLIERNLSITTMESCTSGQIASLITDTEGASAIMKGAFITYSNEVKVMEGVPKETIDTYGVYSRETADAMARTCREKLSADIGIGVTGSFGNVDPANPDSVPGEVYFAIYAKELSVVRHETIPVQDSRLAYKLYVADLIADTLMDLLRN